MIDSKPLADRIAGLSLQARRVAQHMADHGSITRLDAANCIGCFELAARIIDIERAGIRVSRERESGANRFGDKVRWVRYRIAG